MTATTADRRYFYTFPAALVEYMKGKTFTIGCWVYSDDISSDAGGQILLHDDVAGTTNVSPINDTVDTWQFLTATKTFASNITTVNARFFLNERTADDDAVHAYFDGAIVVEGDNVPTFTPKPITEIETYGTIPAFTDTDATPSVALGTKFLTVGTTAITDFDDGIEGQTIIIIAESSITITDGTNIFLHGSANFVMAATDTLTLICKADNKWYELSRAVS